MEFTDQQAEEGHCYRIVGYNLSEQSSEKSPASLASTDVLYQGSFHRAE